MSTGKGNMNMKRTIGVAVTATLIAVLVAVLAPGAEATSKVTLCHNGNTITVGYPAAYGRGGHLFPITDAPRVGHANDYLGECIVPTTTTTEVPVTTTTEAPVTTTTEKPVVTTTTEKPVVTTTTEKPVVTTTTEAPAEETVVIIDTIILERSAPEAEPIQAEPQFTG